MKSTMNSKLFRLVRPLALAAAVIAVALGLAGCASSGNRAPIEDRGSQSRTPSAAGATDAAKVFPGAENAGKPGYYTVRAGDTIARIALENGYNWRDIVRWNNLTNADVIEAGQVLRVVPPATDAAAVAKSVPAPGKVETRPLDPRAAPGAVPGAPAAASAPAAPVVAPVASAPNVGSPPVRDGDDDVNWLWPAGGPVIGNFDEARNAKGLVIAGKAGDAVLAAADGRVVYAGSGLRGYGNLVIVKHNATYLTAYAHNQALLVKEDQVVRRGQKIAEMGSSDAERVQLHFEIRRQGKPIDPAKLLPPR
jgi:lipoprotein NlpD